MVSSGTRGECEAAIGAAGLGGGAAAAFEKGVAVGIEQVPLAGGIFIKGWSHPRCTARNRAKSCAHAP